MCNTLRGRGLYEAHMALVALAKNPELLDRARDRFEKSPACFKYLCSDDDDATESQFSTPSDDCKKREQLEKQYGASHPYRQFQDQAEDEYRRICQASPEDVKIYWSQYRERARERVKNRWIEQGIWKDWWDSERNRIDNWKHEEPLLSESESEWEIEPAGLSQPGKRRPKSDEQLRLIAERRPVRAREHEASRPFHQFIYQVSKERERVLAESGPDGPSFSDLPDINTKAYERVKATWTRRGIWDRKWGVLPGMSWKHEQPHDEWLAEEMEFDPVFREGSPHEDRSPPSPPSIFFNLQPLWHQSPEELSRNSSVGSQEPPRKDHEYRPYIWEPDLPEHFPLFKQCRSPTTQSAPASESPPLSAPVQLRRSNRLKEKISKASAKNLPNAVTDKTKRKGAVGKQSRVRGRRDINIRA